MVLFSELVFPRVARLTRDLSWREDNTSLIAHTLTTLVRREGQRETGK